RTSSFSRTDPYAQPTCDAASRRPRTSELLDRRHLDQQLLRPDRVEPHVVDALRALPVHHVVGALAEVVMADAVAARQLEVAVVAHTPRHQVGELSESRLLVLGLERLDAPPVLAGARRIQRARLRAAATVDISRCLPPVDEV